LYPLVVKPVFGDNGTGVSLVHSMDEWQTFSQHTWLAQRFVAPSDGCDLKLYCIGDQVWGVRKACSVEALRDFLPAAGGCVAERIAITKELVGLAQRCRRLFQLDLCGIDCIQAADGLFVIEVNDFPNYSAVPAAGERLAEYVCNYVRESRV
jgi:glutathione synthase/RimK-type ligase-like ATP-grasp enzyme